MIAIFTDNDGSFSNREAIQKLEFQIDYSLSNYYKEFLLKENGGIPTPHCIRVLDIDTNEMYEEYIAYIFGFYPAHKDRDLYSAFAEMSSNNKSLYLPVASCYSQNIFVMSLAGDDSGNIYFRDHMKETGDKSFNKLSFIAPSFEDFLNQLLPSSQVDSF